MSDPERMNDQPLAKTRLYKGYKLQWSPYTNVYWIVKDDVILQQFLKPCLDWNFALALMQRYVDNVYQPNYKPPKRKAKIQEPPELPEAIKEALRWKQRA